MNLSSSHLFKIKLLPLISIKGSLLFNFSFRIFLFFILFLRLCILTLSNSIILAFNLVHKSIGLGLYFSSIIILYFSNQIDLLVLIY
ncbi:unknown similar to AMEV176 [Choristoneura biennis entomopoxvirus]|uniref:Uncharacterized protein n=1 Tax=Choristoneura biennis entomopoxvirus TaxID=10288 RepID=A0A916KPU1_CBEPV|nr:unknown similar to AMEV176 [Choristoneura biennis entomopoxvirus]CCU55839.1 unknown similar to AMEV176 [Choristoneura biennis entomopoxvirus]